MSKSFKVDTAFSSKRYGTFASILIGCSFTVLAILLSSEKIDFYLYFSVLWLVVSICAYFECIINYIDYERSIKANKSGWNYHYLGTIGYYLGYYSFILSIIYLMLDKSLFIISFFLYLFFLYKCVWWSNSNIEMIFWLIKKRFSYLYVVPIILIELFFYIGNLSYVGIEIFSTICGSDLFILFMILFIIFWLGTLSIILISKFPVKYIINDHKDIFETEKLSKLFDKFIEDIKKIDKEIEIYMKKKFVGFRYKNKTIGYVYSQRKSFEIVGVNFDTKNGKLIQIQEQPKVDIKAGNENYSNLFQTIKASYDFLKTQFRKKVTN